MEDFIDELLELEEIEEVYAINSDRRCYTVRDRINLFDKWNDHQFFRRFRLKKTTVQLVLQQIESDLLNITERNQLNFIPPMTQLLITLRFFATGSFYKSIGDLGGVSKSAVGKIIKKVSTAIAQLRKRYIDLPSTEAERNIVIEKFYKVAGFPRVIGAIDSTHVRIQTPGGNQAESFRNRKGYFSLNVQVVCDADEKFTNIVARWPGATDDSDILDNSRLRASFENGDMGDSVLLGDGGYPVLRYLITPLPDPEKPSEILFNESQIQTRSIVERLIGNWKRRFPVLSVGMRCRIPLVQVIIVATAVLQNIARNENEEEPLEENPDLVVNIDDDVPVPPDDYDSLDDSEQKQFVQYFANLLGHQ